MLTILFYVTTAQHCIFTSPVQKPEDWKREQKVRAASFLAPTPASVQQKSDDDGSLAAAYVIANCHSRLKTPLHSFLRKEEK
jgi:hypothetical protein